MQLHFISYLSSFIEERARRDLHQLTKVGVRVSGSIATDLITVQQFEEILAKIQENVSSGWSIEKSVQRPTGSFWIEDDDGQTSSYSKVDTDKRSQIVAYCLDCI